MTDRSAEPFVLPCKIGREDFAGYDRQRILDLRRRPLAELCTVPRLAQDKMLRKTPVAQEALRRMPPEEWFALLRRAGELFSSASLPLGDRSVDLATHVELVSQASGLPASRVRTSLDALVADCGRFEQIVDAQCAGLDPDCLRTGRTGRLFSLAPAGKNLAVRVPANSPAINITWMIALALRRPVILGVSPEEPFTPLRLVEALYAAGLPDGAVSLMYEERGPIFERADQVLWAGDVPKGLATAPRRVKTYHQGRSKAVVFGDGNPELWERLATMSRRGAGRLCTNLSGLLVLGDAQRTGRQLAEAMARLEILPLEHPDAILAAVPDRSFAQAIDDAIEAAIRRGATDLSAQVAPPSRLIEHDGLTFLRPTVLQIDVDDRFFSAELPFPFVTVAQVTRERVIPTCRGSLIVSMFGADRELVREAAADPGIDKIFQDELGDRGYDSLDPHEGFLLDFLYLKKAFWPMLSEV